MWKAIFIFFSLLYVNLSVAQKTLDFGFLAGRTYYNGELNPKNHVGGGFGSFAFGAVLRYNLNMRYSLKATYTRGKLIGDDELLDFPFSTQRQASFESTLNDFSASIEFNFLPYELGNKTFWGTPYIFAGLTYYGVNPQTQIEGFDPQPINAEKGYNFAFPFGVGLKANLTPKIAIALEWGFRKTTNDAIDGLDNRFNEIFETGKTHDNDWISVSGIMLTYQLTNKGACPAYNF